MEAYQILAKQAMLDLVKALIELQGKRITAHLLRASGNTDSALTAYIRDHPIQLEKDFDSHQGEEWDFQY